MSEQRKQVQRRINKHLNQFDKMVMMCDSKEEMLALGAAMLSTARSIFRTCLGESGLKEMIKGMLR